MQAGDVIELTVGEEDVTAVVLLVNDTHVILDVCDGSVPAVFELGELGTFRVFRPEAFAAAA